eukprot:TRINITY_DN7784_c0_g1_i1.p1 TRINITY_DN7784_c0_g1~~TRINITY_DN7784_c0_g1_i1.p1  ORF type:complete len:501 (-),score=118.62 TRINITY_DN7784_c0_g1_i1:116-1618(-)
MGTVEHGKMALILWCRAISRDYNINIVDFGDSWQDGIAFCAILYHFASPAHPELIDFTSLPTMKTVDVLSLAFSVAEKMGVPRILSVEDMHDKRAIFNFITQLYLTFKPAKEGYLHVLTSSGSREWKREWVRYIVNRHCLCFGSKILPAAETFTIALRQAGTSASVELIPWQYLHKEAVSQEIQKKDHVILALHVGTACYLFHGDSPQETKAWYDALIAVPPNDPTCAVTSASTNPKLQGFLLKRGDKGPKKDFKKRFFDLQDTYLSFWPSQSSFKGKNSPPWNKEKPSNALSMVYCLKFASTVTESPTYHPLSFVVDFPGRQLVLRSESKETLDEWIQALKSGIDYCMEHATRITPCREKEGALKVESVFLQSINFWVQVCQGTLILHDPENTTRVKAKIALFECDLEAPSQATPNCFRVIVGGRDNKNARAYTVTCAAAADTMDWYNVICRQRWLVHEFVNSMVFEVSPGSRVIDRASARNATGAPAANGTTPGAAPQ